MLKQSITYQLASLAEDAIRPGGRVFEQRFGLNVHELRVLRLIDDQPGITFTQLAEQTKFERSATSRILSRLIKARLVIREISENDARQFLLRATAEGVALRAKADPLSLEMEALMLSSLSPAEQQQFRALLDRLTSGLDTHFLAELAARYPEATTAPRRRTRRKPADSRA